MIHWGGGRPKALAGCLGVSMPSFNGGALVVFKWGHVLCTKNMKILLSSCLTFKLQRQDTVDGRNPANHLRLLVEIPFELQGFIHPRWLFGIPSINRIWKICVCIFLFKRTFNKGEHPSEALWAFCWLQIHPHVLAKQSRCFCKIMALLTNIMCRFLGIWVEEVAEQEGGIWMIWCFFLGDVCNDDYYCFIIDMLIVSTSIVM